MFPYRLPFVAVRQKETSVVLKEFHRFREKKLFVWTGLSLVFFNKRSFVKEWNSDEIARSNLLAAAGYQTEYEFCSKPRVFSVLEVARSILALLEREKNLLWGTKLLIAADTIEIIVGRRCYFERVGIG